MKTTLQSIIVSLLAAFALTAAAQDTKTTTTTTVNQDGTVDRTTKTITSTGTLTEYVPGTTFIVKESAGPITYRYGTKVAYVTKSGRILNDEEIKTRIKVGVPVSVHYDLNGDVRVVNRVVIDD